MGGVRGPRGVIEEERPVGRNRFLVADPLDRLIGHIVIEAVIAVPQVGFNRFRALESRRAPLVGVAADKAVEILEAKTRGPSGC